MSENTPISTLGSLPPSQFVLWITDGDDTHEIILTKAIVTIGNDTGDDIRINSTVSLRLRRSLQYYIVERRTENGRVRLHNAELMLHSEAILRSGEELLVDEHLKIHWDLIPEIRIDSASSSADVERAGWMGRSTVKMSQTQQAVPYQPAMTTTSYSSTDQQDAISDVITVTPTPVDNSPSNVVLVAAQPSDLAHFVPTRIGCKLCFYTLDPDDSDENKRTFLRVGNDHYHAKCWHALPESANNPGVSVVIGPISPLPNVIREPLMGPTESSNYPEDKPLGISASTLKIGDPVQTFFIRNNSDETMTFPSIFGAAWANFDCEVSSYDHAQTDSGPSTTFSLPSGAIANVTLTCNFIRPWYSRIEVPIYSRKSVTVTIERISLSLPISLLVLGLLLEQNLSALWSSLWIFGSLLRGAFYTGSPVGSLAGFLITELLLVAWFVMMQPGRTLWIAFLVVQRLNEIAQSISVVHRGTELLLARLWVKIQCHDVLYIHQPFGLISLVLPLSLGIGIPLCIASILVFSLINWLGLGLLGWLAYAAALILLIDFTLLDYNIQLLLVSRRIINFFVAQVKAHLP